MDYVISFKVKNEILICIWCSSNVDDCILITSNAI